MLTNAQLQDLIEELTKRVGAIEEHMKVYEKQTRAIHTILQRVEMSVDSYKQSFIRVIRFLRWLGAVGTGVLITYIASIAIHYLHP